MFNTVSMIQDAALAGFGIAHLPQDQVQTHLDRGELVRLLADWCPPSPVTTCTTRAVADNWRRSRCWSRRCATGTEAATRPFALTRR